ncbi:MAG: TlpA family protein disulfide reductase [Bacteroidaceae bacterium]|nr:TlpA family protein disulfide reductase [Bacteroidaceae bacterium]
MRKIALILLATLITACGNKTNTTESTTEQTTNNVKCDSVTVYEHDYIVKVGDIAPDFSLKYTDGNNFTLSQLRGKVVMLQFTASWCGICRNEMPHIEKEIWQRHKNNPNFVLVGVDREETKEVIEDYTAKVGTTYPMLIDEKGDAFASYAVRKSGITRNVLIDKNGRIVMLTRRYVEPEFNQLVQTIDSLLAE